jgi:hypothetical protein
MAQFGFGVVVLDCCTRVVEIGDGGGDRLGANREWRHPLQTYPRAGFLGRGFALGFSEDFGGADFAHGGVAGAVAGPPHVPAGDGAIGPPALAES